MDLDTARLDLAAIFRWSARLGLSEGVCNHFSCAPDPNHFLVNPSGLHWSEITASRLLLVDSHGKGVEGLGEVEDTAFFIHWSIHAGLPHARYVLHTHMPYATAITATEGGRLRMASQNAMRFAGDIRYEDEYDGLALGTSEGDRICEALGDKRIAFLASHGVIVVGQTVAQAFDDLYYLERACQLQYYVQSAGQKLGVADDRIAKQVAKQFADYPELAMGHLGAIRRILDREEPEYAD